MTDDTSRRRDSLPDGDDLKGWREGLAEARGLAEERRVFAAMLELNGGGLDGYGWPILPVPLPPGDLGRRAGRGLHLVRHQPRPARHEQGGRHLRPHSLSPARMPGAGDAIGRRPRAKALRMHSRCGPLR